MACRPERLLYIADDNCVDEAFWVTCGIAGTVLFSLAAAIVLTSAVYMFWIGRKVQAAVFACALGIPTPMIFVFVGLILDWSIISSTLLLWVFCVFAVSCLTKVALLLMMTGNTDLEGKPTEEIVQLRRNLWILNGVFAVVVLALWLAAIGRLVLGYPTEHNYLVAIGEGCITLMAWAIAVLVRVARNRTVRRLRAYVNNGTVLAYNSGGATQIDVGNLIKWIDIYTVAQEIIYYPGGGLCGIFCVIVLVNGECPGFYMYYLFAICPLILVMPAPVLFLYGRKYQSRKRDEKMTLWQWLVVCFCGPPVGNAKDSSVSGSQDRPVSEILERAAMELATVDKRAGA
jgi:hypothetical protein